MEIWKFRLDPSGEIEMPEESETLSVATIDNEAFLWALVNPESPRVVKKFSVIGTGWECQPTGKFIGTFFTTDFHPTLVWHVFEPPSQEKES